MSAEPRLRSQLFCRNVVPDPTKSSRALLIKINFVRRRILMMHCTTEWRLANYRPTGNAMLENAGNGALCISPVLYE